MKNRSVFLTRTLFVFLIVITSLSIAFGQPANHTLTVNVSEITWILVTANVNLNITSGSVTEGQNLMTISDQTSSLNSGLNGTSKKITVRTNNGTALYTLKVQAVSPTQGTPTSTVTLGTLAQDILLGMGRSLGSCTLRYTAEALASLGTGTDSHIITFTVQTQ